eukprot:981458-Rhodomonas_salina.1
MQLRNSGGRLGSHASRTPSTTLTCSSSSDHPSLHLAACSRFTTMSEKAEPGGPLRSWLSRRSLSTSSLSTTRMPSPVR